MRFRLVIALLLFAACPKPMPDPGNVVLSCVMDAAKDPKLIDAVMNALSRGDFMSALASLINPVLGVTAEAIACIVHSIFGKAQADPAHPERYEHARAYLKAHGYQVQ